MHKALNDNTWPGDIDACPEPVNHHIWQQIQADKHSCLKHLSDHSHCPFQRQERPGSG